MTSSAGTAASHAPHLHISTITSPSTHQNSHSPVGIARSPHPTSGSPSPTSGSTNQACAACKYQRRKCNPDCPLAPYFPADQQRRFLHAHRLFGVSNIQKTLRRIKPEYGPEAMRALIYQSEARAYDPVFGCVGIIKALELQIHEAKQELDALHHQIAIYRQAAAGGDPLVDPAALQAAAQQGQGNVLMTMDALYGGADRQSVQATGAGFVFNDHQQQLYNDNASALKVDDQDEPAPLPLCDYFYDGAPGDESTSHDAIVNNNEYCYSEASVKQTTGSPGMTTLGEQLEQHCQIESAPLMDAFDVKPQNMPMTMMEFRGGSGVDPPEEKVASAVMKYDPDQKVAELAPAAAKCHLELGFTSF